MVEDNVNSKIKIEGRPDTYEVKLELFQSHCLHLNLFTSKNLKSQIIK